MPNSAWSKKKKSDFQCSSQHSKLSIETHHLQTEYTYCGLTDTPHKQTCIHTRHILTALHAASLYLLSYCSLPVRYSLRRVSVLGKPRFSEDICTESSLDIIHDFQRLAGMLARSQQQSQEDLGNLSLLKKG